MKKSLLVLSILLPAIAHGATPDNKPTTTEDTPKVEVKVEVKKEEPKKLEQTTKLMDSCDLEDGGVSLALTDTHLKLTGKLPKECADRLSLTNVEHFDAPKSSETPSDISITKKDDLKEYSASIQAQVSFTSDDDHKSLRECVAKASPDSEQVELSSNPLFAKKVSHGSEIAIAGLRGEPMNLKSPEFIKIEQKIAGAQCTNCNSDWTKVKARLIDARSVNSPLFTAVIEALFLDFGVNTEKRIKTASFSDLKKIDKELDEMLELASSADQRKMVDTLRLEAGSRNTEIATGPDHKKYNATEHADFAKSTYEKLAASESLSAEEKAEFKKSAADMAPGKDARIQFLSSIDGRNKEVRDYLSNWDRAQERLEIQARIACFGQRNFAQCGALNKQLQENRDRVANLQSAKTMADNDAANRMFAFWDQTHTAYDYSLRTTLIKPVAPLTSNLPLMYDPKDPKYQNFDPSKMYQASGVVAPESLPFYSVQPYSLAPANS